MLNLFRKNPRQVLTRGQLLEKLWDIVVAKSDENNELQEVNNKLGALKKAILLAEKI